MFRSVGTEYGRVHRQIHEPVGDVLCRERHEPSGREGDPAEHQIDPVVLGSLRVAEANADHERAGCYLYGVEVRVDKAARALFRRCDRRRRRCGIDNEGTRVGDVRGRCEGVERIAREIAEGAGVVRRHGEVGRILSGRNHIFSGQRRALSDGRERDDRSAVEGDVETAAGPHGLADVGSNGDATGWGVSAVEPVGSCGHERKHGGSDCVDHDVAGAADAVRDCGERGAAERIVEEIEHADVGVGGNVEVSGVLASCHDICAGERVAVGSCSKQLGGSGAEGYLDRRTGLHHFRHRSNDRDGLTDRVSAIGLGRREAGDRRSHAVHEHAVGGRRCEREWDVIACDIGDLRPVERDHG